jgi:two-component system, cell cycle response regulator DivK
VSGGGVTGGEAAPMRVLIVEDNETNRDTLKRRLQRHGVDVRIAIEGESAVAEAEWGHPDVILMDISLPREDGLAVTRRLKSHVRTQHIPVIALTADAFAEDRHHALAAGCAGFHAKPVDFEALLDTLRQFDKKKAA